MRRLCDVSLLPVLLSAALDQLTFRLCQPPLNPPDPEWPIRLTPCQLPCGDAAWIVYKIVRRDDSPRRNGGSVYEPVWLLLLAGSCPMCTASTPARPVLDTSPVDCKTTPYWQLPCVLIWQLRSHTRSVWPCDCPLTFPFGPFFRAIRYGIDHYIQPRISGVGRPPLAGRGVADRQEAP